MITRRYKDKIIKINKYPLLSGGYIGDFTLYFQSISIGKFKFEINRYRNHNEITLHNKKILDLYDLEIIEQYRGLKHGTFLMNRLIHFCKSNNIDIIRLEVENNNKIAYNLYCKFNFTSYKSSLDSNIFEMVLYM